KVFRREATNAFKDLLVNQTKNEAEILALNFGKRREIVSYAYNETKFYKAFYDSHDFHPSHLKTEEDWDKIPVLLRKDIVENEKDIIVKGCEKYLRSITTGGSSGVPLRVFHDTRFPSEVLGWRMLRWWD